MSVPSAPTKPDVTATGPAADPRENDGFAPRDRASSPQSEASRAAPSERQGDEGHQMARQALGSAPSDRAVDADLLIDIPKLSVEELSLELDASLLLNRVKLDAKGLEAGLYAKANFDNVTGLTHQGPGTPLGTDPSRDVSVQRQLQGGHASAREAYARFTTQDEPARERPVRERARQALTRGAKAAGLTAAGLAAGVLLESHSKPSRKLSILGRRNRARAVRDATAKRLP
jgi:hypothetical protein